MADQNAIITRGLVYEQPGYPTFCIFFYIQKIVLIKGKKNRMPGRWLDLRSEAFCLRQLNHLDLEFPRANVKIDWQCHLVTLLIIDI